MKRVFAGVLSILMLFSAGCSVKTETAEFVVPAPAVDVPEPTPVPEPAPTQKPKSEYNGLLDQLKTGSSNGTGMRINPYPTRAHGIENNSEITILATVLEKENVMFQTDYGMWDGYQRGKVVVEKCFRGDFREGDILEIKEFAHIVSDEERTWLNNMGWFFPSREYETYLLFLEKGDGDYYCISEDHCGKYPVTPAFAEACESGVLSCDVMQVVQRDTIPGGGYDRNVPPEDLSNLFLEVYAHYYQDEKIQEILEKERIYEEHYGRPEPAAAFAPIPNEENLLWVYARRNVIYVPATVVSDASPIEEVHDKMNEKGFVLSDLQTLDVDTNQFRMWINEKDVSFAERREDEYGAETVVSVYSRDGALLAEDVESHECMKLIKKLNFEPVVISVTTRLYSVDENTCYHAFFIADVDAESYSF